MYSTQLFTGTVNDVYPQLISRILEKGKVTKPRGKVCRELNPAILEISAPRQRLVTSHNRLVNVPFALAEVLWILSGRNNVSMLSPYNGQIANYSDDGVRFNAAYGERIRTAFGHDQVKDMILALQKDPDTRQAELVIAHPEFDRSFEDGNGIKFRDVKDRACNVFAHAMIREGALNWTQILRSNDAIWGVPYNLIQWTHVMEYVAAHVGVEMGQYIMLSDSMHIYESGESAGELDNARNITPFNLYAKCRFEHKPMPRTTPKMLESVCDIELELRTAESVEDVLQAISGLPDGYWGDVLLILAAYHVYRLGRGIDKPTAQYRNRDLVLNVMARSGDPVYSAATAKFFFVNRWSKQGEQENLHNEIASYLPGGPNHQAILSWITA